MMLSNSSRIRIIPQPQYGFGYGYLGGNGYGSGNTVNAAIVVLEDIREQISAVRLLTEDSPETGFYMCQLHTLGGWS
jgi:hypothetical protein